MKKRERKGNRVWRKGKLRKEGRVWCVEGGGWADAMKVGLCEVWGREWESEVADGWGVMIGWNVRRAQWVTNWNWNGSDRMESFGFDINGLDIPSGSLMRH
jgi:hypothetical protein